MGVETLEDIVYQEIDCLLARSNARSPFAGVPPSSDQLAEVKDTYENLTGSELRDALTAWNGLGTNTPDYAASSQTPSTSQTTSTEEK